jgi:gamma-glutamyl:cysteine ligase YbdK (ATP-grasp superfamily)
MNKFTAALSALALLAGIGGGVVAFQSAMSSASSPAPAGTTVTQPPPARAAQTRVHVRWAPCKAPAKRHGRACVIDLVHTIVVPAGTSAQGVGQFSQQGDRRQGAETEHAREHEAGHQSDGEVRHEDEPGDD